MGSVTDKTPTRPKCNHHYMDRGNACVHCFDELLAERDRLLKRQYKIYCQGYSDCLNKRGMKNQASLLREE